MTDKDVTADAIEKWVAELREKREAQQRTAREARQAAAAEFKRRRHVGKVYRNAWRKHR